MGRLMSNYVTRMGPNVQAFVQEALPFSHWGMRYFDIRLMEYALADGMFANVLSRGGARAVDVGCGLGLASTYLADFFENVDGTDLDHVDAAFAGGRPAAIVGQEIITRIGVSNISLHCGDSIAFLNQNAGAYDLVFSHFVLEHVAEINEITSAMARALRPGGRMFHIVPNTHDTIIQLLTRNLDPLAENAKTAWKLRGQTGRVDGRIQGNLFTPITHSEFISDYREQFDVNCSERYLFPLLEAGLIVRDIKPMREHAYGILAEKPEA
jgi:2-polyprenyl-3-methyl-5-hydroxy-6-metoxy-1,4-benzoquinol methylase